MKSGFVKVVLLCLFTGFVLCISAQKVSAQNSITGIVFDQNRKPVPEIDVELLDGFERYIRSTKTKGSGLYFFQGLRAGVYYVRVRVDGTAFMESKERIQIGQANRVNQVTGGVSGSESLQVNFNLQIDPRRIDNSPINNSVVFAQNVPTDAQASYESALEKLEKQKKDEGIEDLRAAISIFPDYYLALDRLGREYLSQGKFVEAENVFKKAIDVNPKSFSSFFGLSVARHNLGKKDETVATLKKAIELNPGSVSAFLLLGIVQREMKKFNEAEASLKKAKEISDNKEPDVHWNLALLYYYNLKRYNAAADELELYLKAMPDDKNQETEEKKAQVKKLIKTLREKSEKSS
ncbi:MAG: tetratricopeptide repeat protein [Pyrinomonadaceae bacterium]